MPTKNTHKKAGSGTARKSTRKSATKSRSHASVKAAPTRKYHARSPRSRAKRAMSAEPMIPTDAFNDDLPTPQAAENAFATSMAALDAARERDGVKTVAELMPMPVTMWRYEIKSCGACGEPHSLKFQGTRGALPPMEFTFICPLTQGQVVVSGDGWEERPLDMMSDCLEIQDRSEGGFEGGGVS